MKRIITLTLGLVAAAGLTHSTAAKMNVVATTTMVTDMVKEVGGDRVSVVGMMGAGVDPHLYKPASGDVVKLQRAKVIFYSGLMLEGRMADLFFKMARAGKKVYAVTESIPKKIASSRRSSKATGIRTSGATRLCGANALQRLSMDSVPATRTARSITPSAVPRWLNLTRMSASGH